MKPNRVPQATAKLISLLTAVVFGLFLAALWATNTPAQDKPRGTKLQADEMVKMYTPPLITLGYDARFAALFSNAFATNGVVLNQVLRPSATGEQQRGRWRLNNDAICTHLPSIGYEVCAHIYRIGDGSFEAWESASGVRIGTFRVRHGE